MRVANTLPRTGGGGRIRCRGSVLLIVLVTLAFATLALLTFMDRASNDLLVEVREADASHLREEAYSALETTLAVLEDFRAVNGALRSPAQGWSDPLGWVGYQPAEGREVTVTLEDESGKLPLGAVDFTTLVALFTEWGMLEFDAEALADALLGWMRKDYTPVTAGAPRIDAYERTPLPFAPPGRPLRSFRELAAIDGVKEAFFDEYGNPNELWTLFTQTVSLFNYRQPNINSAPPAVLGAVSRFDEFQRGQLSEFLNGTGAYAFQGPGYFQRANEVTNVLGAQSQPQGMGAEIQALRILVTVREGLASFNLNVVVAPPNGARLVAPVRTEGEQTASTSPAPVAPRRPAAGTAAEPQPINYPYTLLELRENDAISMVSDPLDEPL